MSNAPKVFSKRLTEIIQSGTKTVTEIFDKSGVSRTMIYGIRDGIYSPSLETAEKIALACGFTLPEFLGVGDHSIDECNRRVQKEWKRLRRK